jgi:NADP-dependent 3-hydroxy acid dehydrogenase YdfG
LLSKFAIDVITLNFDVRVYSECEEAINSVTRPIDILINNAGLARGLNFIHEGKLEHWEEMIDTNIKGLIYMTRLVSPQMVERQSGHIINLGSSAGKEVYPKGNVYSATKFAVEGFTKSIRTELHAHNVRVSQVSPGHVEETEFAKVRFDGDAERAKIYNDFNPLTSRDVAEVIYFIASRPPHVNIQDVFMMGTQQAANLIIDRTGRKYDPA